MKSLLCFILLILSIQATEFREYIIIPRGFLELKEEAKPNSKTVQRAIEGQRFFISGKENNWFQVELKDGNTAYIERDKISFRELRVEKALLEINSLNFFISENLKNKKEVVMLNSYAFNGNLDTSKIEKDSRGKRVLNSQKAYESKDLKGNWIYIADRQILVVETNDRNEPWIEIKLPNENKTYYVDRKTFRFSRFPRINKEIDKFIIIDNLNQNMMIYQRQNKQWKLLKSPLISTGYDNGNNSFRTPSGVFLVANLKDNMLYKNRDKDNNLKKGQAPYAVRFSGGNYLHGIPVEEDIDERREMIVRKWREDLLGSYALSQGCVRNRDEIAKYIFNWIRHRRNNEGYIYPLETVSVIVFD